MKKSKAGIVTATVLIVLLVIGVMADFLYDRYHMPTYEHGEIVSVSWYPSRVDDNNSLACVSFYREYHVYKEGNGYRFAYVCNKDRQEFDLSEADYTKFMKNDFNEYLEKGTIGKTGIVEIEFEDGTVIGVPEVDNRIMVFFRACGETFLNHASIYAR